MSENDYATQPSSASAPQTMRMVWGVGTPRTLRVHWALHELGLDYQISPIVPRLSEAAAAELMRQTGRRKIPVLQDGTLTIAESAAIVSYLSNEYGTEGSSLLPRDCFARVRAMEWCYFIMTELDATSLYVIRRHRGLKGIYGAAPNAVEAARQYFLSQLEAAEQRFSASSRYLMGDQFSVPDILLTSCLLWAREEQLNLGESCDAYLQRTTTRPAYRMACAANADTR